MFLYNVDNLKIKLRKSYNSLYQRIRNSRNSLIVQLYYYNVLYLHHYLPYGINLYLGNTLDFDVGLIFVRLNYCILYGPLLCMSD